MSGIRSFLNFLQYEKRYSQHTIKAYKTDLDQYAAFLQEVYHSDNLLESTHQHIRSWLVSLVEKKLDARSLNRKLSSLKSYFKFEIKRGKIGCNPLARVVAPKMKKRLPSYVSQKQMEQLFGHVDFGESFEGIRNRTILETFYSTGIRVSELTGLTDQAIDFSSSQLKVLGKGNKERLLPMTRTLAHQFGLYLESRDQLLQGAACGTFFVTKHGNRLSPRSVYRVVNEWLKKVATIDQKSPHVLRHTFATHLINNGAEISAIKELLGHASLAATQVYTHNTIEKLKEVYRRSHPKA